VTEIEKLLESPTRTARIGALSVMDKQARRKRTGERRAEPFRLYLRRVDRIAVERLDPEERRPYLGRRPSGSSPGIAGKSLGALRGGVRGAGMKS
jgi:hypothetical protein